MPDEMFSKVEKKLYRITVQEGAYEQPQLCLLFKR
jgi:hypothetical protein